MVSLSLILILLPSKNLSFQENGDKRSLLVIDPMSDQWTVDNASSDLPNNTDLLIIDDEIGWPPAIARFFQ